VYISVKKITHFGMIYNDVLLTRQIPSGNTNRRIFCAAGNNKKVSKRRNRATGRRATLPPGGSAGFGYVSRVWVTVWVRRLPHILPHTTFNVFTTKKHRKPKFSMLFGAAGRIRTADLILTKDALYLLSYSSKCGDQEGARTLDLQRDRLAF
jgi:hypothetical protein